MTTTNDLVLWSSAFQVDVVAQFLQDIEWYKPAQLNVAVLAWLQKIVRMMQVEHKAEQPEQSIELDQLNQRLQTSRGGGILAGISS